MLSPINQLKKKNDFDRVFKAGRGFKENFLFLKIVKNNLKNSRFGFVVSKKFSNKAVVRNKIKRRLREAVKINLQNIKGGIDVVVMVIPGLSVNDFWELEGLVKKLLNKAKILKTNNA